MELLATSGFLYLLFCTTSTLVCLLTTPHSVPPLLLAKEGLMEEGHTQEAHKMEA
jgi:hypothetical protein